MRNTVIALLGFVVVYFLWIYFIDLPRDLDKCIKSGSADISVYFSQMCTVEGKIYNCDSLSKEHQNIISSLYDGMFAKCYKHNFMEYGRK